MAESPKSLPDPKKSSGNEANRTVGKGSERKPVPGQADSAKKSVYSTLSAIKSIADIPKIKTIHTGAGADYELPLARREKCVAVGLENGKVWIVVDAGLNREQPIVVSHLRDRMRSANLDVVRTVVAEPSLIASIYEAATRLHEASVSEEPQTAEGRLFDEIVQYGAQNRATDIHFEVREQYGSVRFRIDGDLELMRNDTAGVFTMEQLRDAIGFAYNKLQSQRTGSHASFSPDANQSCMIPYMIDGDITNLRYQAGRMWGGFDIVIRYLKSKTVKSTNFEDLGYSDDQAKMLDIAARTRTGMVLIVGITGSGKSTTLKTVVANIPDKSGLKIFTVEDPVEDLVPGASQISVQRTMQAESQKQPLKELEGILMRMDPDCIMLGEIRDKDSGSTAQAFLETGHQVLATLHASSALGTFPRLLSESIAFTMSTITSKQFWSLIIYQALVPKLCPDCKIPAEDVMPKVLEFITYRFGIHTEDMCIKNPDGCPKCNSRGTIGQTVVAEMIQPTRKFLSLIRDGEDFKAELAWRDASDKKFDTPNMTGKTVFEHALYKAFIGLIDIRVVERFETFERYENIWES